MVQFFKKSILRRLGLAAVFTTGIVGVLASGGGGGNGDSLNPCAILVHSIAPARDGSNDIWIGVEIGNVDLVNSVVRLISDGSENINVRVAGGDETGINIIRTVEVATDGSNDVYAGGDFSKGILRLNEDGSIDPSFSMGRDAAHHALITEVITYATVGCLSVGILMLMAGLVFNFNRAETAQMLSPGSG